MDNCEIKIADNIDNLAKNFVEGKPSYKFNEKTKNIDIVIGGNSKAKDMFSASKMAINVAKNLNKALNDEIFLDNVYIANANIVERKISKRYMEGMLAYENTKTPEVYKKFIKKPLQSNLEKGYFAMNIYKDDIELSNKMLQEQEDAENLDIIQNLINNNEVNPICSI